MACNVLKHRLIRAVLFSGLSILPISAYSTQQLCQETDIVATTPSTRFEQHDNGTVTDTVTGLMWQRCLIGQSANGCTLGTADTFTWAEALIYPSQKTQQSTLAGYQDWRLPNIRELASIIELQCSHPAINLTIFPNNGAGHLWSSSPYRFYTHYSWFLDFNDGLFIYGDRQDKKSIRLIRDIRPIHPESLHQN